MTANAPVPDWTNGAISFLSRQLPTDDNGASFNHMFSSAYQMGCMALVALGQADETVRGAIPRQTPTLPDVLPRWDDICVAVVALANQRHRLSFRLPDGSVPHPNGVGFAFIRLNAPPPPAPTIAAAHGLGPAHAAQDVLAVLQSLGLIADGCWTKVAEPLLWRESPSEWQLEITHDPRFLNAVEIAIATVPDDIRNHIAQLVTITDADVTAAVTQSATTYEENRAKFGPKARLSAPRNAELAHESLARSRPHQIDWLFFRRWRLADGWLTNQQATRALEIFHDRLAITMRRAVIARLHPDKPDMAKH